MRQSYVLLNRGGHLLTQGGVKWSSFRGSSPDPKLSQLTISVIYLLDRNPTHFQGAQA